MTSTALLLGSAPENQVDHIASFNGIYHFGELRAISSTTPNSEYYIGMRFTTVPSITQLRRAKLQLAVLHNYDDLHITFKGHKVGNSPAFGHATNPRARWEANPTTASLYFSQSSIPSTKAFNIPDPDDSLLAIIEEIISLPDYAPGNPITLLGRCSNAFNAEAIIYAGSSVDLGPRLILKYGSLTTDASVWQQTDIGDSLAAYLSHDGYEIPALSVVFMGSTTVGKAAAGMQNATIGDMYGGDNFRGFETPATIERIFIDEFGDENVDMIRNEKAVAGTTLGQWYSDINNLVTGLWGDPNEPTSTRYKLTNPETPWQLIWLSAGGNDMHAFGSQNRLISEEDDNVSADAAWQAYVDDLQVQLIGVIDEIYNRADPDLTWIILPGYPNFCVKKSNNPNPQILPASGSRLTNAQDTFRTVYSLQISIGGCQFLYDSIGYSAAGEIHNPYSDITLQSALVRAAALWQQWNHPEEIAPGYQLNPTGAWWNYALLQVGFPLLGPLSYSTWGFGGVDRWNESWRNVTDITVNMRMRMLDSMYENVAAMYPKVLFFPSRQSMGVHSTYSADPSSEFAQSNPLDWVEGIHPNKDGLTKWLTQPDSDGTPPILDRMTHRVPFLQRFSTSIFYAWDGVSADPIKNAGYYDGVDLIPAYIEWDAAA